MLYFSLCFFYSSCPKHFDFYLMYMLTNHLCSSSKEYWTMNLIKPVKQMGFPLRDNTQKHVLYKKYLFLIRKKDGSGAGKKITTLGKELVISHVPNFPTELRLIEPQGPQTSFCYGFCVETSPIALGRNYSRLIWVWEGDLFEEKLCIHMLI